MASRSLRRLQRDRASSPLPIHNVASPPIFLSPSSFEYYPLASSPSPLPSAAAASHHHPIPTATIVGGGIAGIVTLAATASIISTVAGRAGLNCLLGPICKLLSCLARKLLLPFTDQLSSLSNIFSKLNPASKRHTSNQGANTDDEATSEDHHRNKPLEVPHGSPTTVTSYKGESAAAAAHVVKGDIQQLETSAHAFLVASINDFMESELKKQKEMIMQPLNESIAKAQRYAESLIFSITENASDDDGPSKQSSDAHPNKAGKLKLSANTVGASTEARVALTKQAQEVAMSDKEFGVEAEKTKNTTTNENAAKMKGLVILEEEEVLHRKQGKTPTLLPRLGEAEVFMSDQEALNQKVLVQNKGARRSGQESASDAYTDLQVEAKMGAPSSQKHHHLMDKPTGVGNVRPEPATIVPMPTKARVPVWGRTMTSTINGKPVQGDVMKVRRNKRNRPKNRGRLSFSCDISAFKLQIFSSCRSGVTYESPLASPVDCSINSNNSYNYNYYHDHRIVEANDNYYSSSLPYTAHYPLHLYNASQNNRMHHQHYPLQSISMQGNTLVPTVTQHTPSLSPPLEVVDLR